MLGEFEQVVMLGVLRVGDEAYAVTIWEEIHRQTGRDVALGAIYKTLSRLEEKGLLRSRHGEPTAERGGRRKRYYAVSAAGKRAVQQSLATITRLAAGLELGLDT
ncbi:MAG: transcriptional regulator PadR family protein [Gemmatimonadetes bacterium]|nr:transcriptional regulator PadR family protein [Gemmatimonadota bacterium]